MIKTEIHYIEFEDHCSSNERWTQKDKAFHNVCMAKCVGFLVRESKQYVTLALIGQTENECFSNTMTIIKSCITNRRILK